ncbi:WD40-repeat-containing domain protein [Cladorrhinum sp. PSN259]|nr:WD40-repeat-containing domain protein [Cladorrhinum sp. PSN259]
MPSESRCLSCFGTSKGAAGRPGVGNDGARPVQTIRSTSSRVSLQVSVIKRNKQPANASITSLSPSGRPNSPASPSNAPHKPAYTTQSLPEQIWDRAYDELKKEEPDLMARYETLLSQELVGPEVDGEDDVKNLIEQKNQDTRRQQLRQIIDSGLKKTENEYKMMANVNTSLQTVMGVAKMIATALEAMPQAALAWAGICFVLRVFEGHFEQTDVHRRGIIYVTTRMDWYWNLSTVLTRSDAAQKKLSEGMRIELEKRIGELYKQLLLYQIKSVCFCCRNQILGFLRNVVKLDDWQGELDAIHAAEDALRRDLTAYTNEEIRSNLEHLVTHAQDREAQLLENIYQTLRQQLLVQVSGEDRQCVKDLRLTDPQDDKVRLERTKGGLLKESYSWILSDSDFHRWRTDQETRLLWIKGDPGKGKTMLLIGIINELSRSASTAVESEAGITSYFFCQAIDARLSQATAVLRGLIFLLIIQQRSLDTAKALISHVRRKYDNADRQLFEDGNAFYALSQIFLDILRDPSLRGAWLVVDALDECQEELPELLDLIAETASEPNMQVKWLVSSRYRMDIEQRLKLNSARRRLSLELNEDRLSKAVDIYIDRRVSELEAIKDDGPLKQQIKDRMRQKANGTFLWVSLVFKELQEVQVWDVLKVSDEVPATLKSLYGRMMKQIQQLPRTNPEYCRLVLSTICLAYRPLHILELAVLSGLPKHIAEKPRLVADVVGLCGSFLTIRDDQVYLIHQSAKDFLTTNGFDTLFPDGIAKAHHEIVTRSLNALPLTLKRDIYNLQYPGVSIDQVKDVNPDPLTAVRYSCLFWIDHLGHAADEGLKQQNLSDDGPAHKFLRTSLLHWFEALSLIRSMPTAVVALSNLANQLKDHPQPSQFLAFVRDAQRFILQNRWLIENRPLQAYASALVFSPTNSLTRIRFRAEEPTWILSKPVVESNWSSCVQTLEGHGDSVRSVAYSPDGNSLASSADDRSIRIWDLTTGHCKHTLHGHAYAVKSAVFSPDGSLLASASNDGIVKIWSAADGKCIKTLRGHTDWVRSVSFSSNGSLLASGSHDRTVKIWSVTKGNCLRTLHGHGDWVSSVAFSSGDTNLVSGSNDLTIRIWDVATGRTIHIFQGHTDWVNSLAYSRDGSILASASSDRTIKIWRTDGDRRCQFTFEGHTDWVRSVSFTRDGQYFVSASNDRTIRIWSVASKECVKTLRGHSDSVNAAAFSGDGREIASAWGDKTVKIWDASIEKNITPGDQHKDWVNITIFSPDGNLLASTSDDQTVMVWDTATGKLIYTLVGHNDCVNSIVFSCNSSYLASASSDCTVRIWDLSSGACVMALQGHKDWIKSVVFSHDDRQLASASGDRTIRIWDISSPCRDGPVPAKLLEGHDGWIKSVRFSEDGKLLASASDDKTVRIWEARTGECTLVLQGHRESVNSAVFSPDGKCIASASDDESVRVWDATSGVCILDLRGHRDSVYLVAFSSNGQHLASTSNGSVRIWQISGNRCIQAIVVGVQLSIMSFAFGDSRLITDIGQIILGMTTPPGKAKLALDRHNTGNLARPKESPWYGYGVSADRAWITCHGENVIWLPPEYRVLCCAVLGSMVSIGCQSGKVLILRFSSDEFPIPRQQDDDAAGLQCDGMQGYSSGPPSLATSGASFRGRGSESNDSVMISPRRRDSVFTFGYQPGSASNSQKRRLEGGEKVAENIQTPLHLAVLCGDESQVRKILQDEMINVGAKDQAERTAAFYAMRDGHRGIALAFSKTYNVSEQVIADNLDNATYEYKAQSLYRAIKRQNKDEVRFLIDIGADMEAKGYGDWPGWKGTALHEAAWYGSLEIVRLMLEKGANRRATDIGGRTPAQRPNWSRTPEISAVLSKRTSS